MKILIVDDQLPNRLIVKFFIESEGHTCIQAENGEQAYQMFLEYQPDFVLMDIVMPVMDGYQAASKIKQYAGESHVPIIFLTAKHDEDSLLKCLESGGDDYLVKPINGTLLKAKIRAHERTLELTQQVQAKNKELTAIYSNLSKEHEMGRHVLNHALDRNLKDCPNVRVFMSSMSFFNGDLFLIAENPKGGLYIFLGDFTGHGLSAAMGTIPVSQLFFSMCYEGASVSEIIDAMNTNLKDFLPENMFCAASLIHLFEKGDAAHIWSGGLPEAYLVRSGKGIIKTIKSQNLPLGILNKNQFNNEPSYYRFRQGDKLIVLSDGLLEATNPKTDEMFGEEKLTGILKANRDDLFENLIGAYEEHVGDQHQNDDISLIQILAEPYETKYIRDLHSDASRKLGSIPWELSLDVGVNDIKDDDVVSEIMSLLPSSVRLSSGFDSFKTVFAELYSNSLEHGLLKLSSQIKNKPNGFAEYYEMREKKLSELVEGEISMTLSVYQEKDITKVWITIEDSGEGFKYESIRESDNSDSLLWGRGLSLVKSLTEDMIYSKQGNKVKALMLLD